MALPFQAFDFADDDRPLRKLNVEQRAAMSEAIAAWSTVETLIELLLCALAKAPMMLGQALTEDLGPDHRLKALVRLCNQWTEALPEDETVREMLDEVRKAGTWARKNKDDRNKLVHWQWAAFDDETLACTKISFKPQPDDAVMIFYSVPMAELFGFTDEVMAMAREIRRLQQKLEQLPPWPHK